MGTLSETILGAQAGSFSDKRIDKAFCHDGTGVQAKVIYDEMGAPGIARITSYNVCYTKLLRPVDDGIFIKILLVLPDNNDRTEKPVRYLLMRAA